MKRKEQNIITFYKIAIFILFIGLLFSKFLISLSQFFMLAIWIYEGQWTEKYTKLKQDKPALIFLSIYILFVISLLWTKNIDNALFDLQIKLPLLALPLIFATSQKFTQKDIFDILKLFILSVFAKTLQSLSFIITENFKPDLSQITSEISHIRYSLMIDVAIFALIELFMHSKSKSKSYKFLLFFLSLWFFTFLVFMKSLTGLVIFVITLIYIGLHLLFKHKDLKIKITAIVFVLAVSCGIYFYLNSQIKKFFTYKDLPYNELPKYTQAGNPYIHDTTNIYLENGYRVGYYLCKKELKQQWNRVSAIDYDSVVNGYPIWATLKRYLTSKGLPKDSVGVSKLTKNDIKNIENGIANYKFENTLSISNRIYKVIWQFYVYSKTHNANNQSITQRYEFYKTASHIIKNYPFLGVGVGDVKDAYKIQYEIDKTNLLLRNRLRAHNQIITQVLTLGLLLGSWTVIALFLPFFMNKKNKSFISTTFFILAILSMFTDDVFETSISMSFFAIFYTILILIKPKQDDNKTID